MNEMNEMTEMNEMDEMDEIVKERFQRAWFQFILDHPDKDWYWDGLSRNPSINWKIVQDNPDKPWNWDGDGLSSNKMGYPYVLKIKKVKEITYWNVMENELIYRSGGKKRKLNKLPAYLLANHLI